MVFIISSLDDGTSFTDALSSAFKAEFEIRNPATGALITSFLWIGSGVQRGEIVRIRVSVASHSVQSSANDIMRRRSTQLVSGGRLE